MKRFLSWFTAPILQNAVFFVFLYALGAVCIVFEPWNGSRFWSLFELYFDLYLVCAFLLLIPKGVRRWVKGILAVFLYLVAIVDMALYVRLGAPIVPIFLQMALQSNLQESSEALRAYLNWGMLWSPLLLVFLILLLHLFFSFWRKADSFFTKIKSEYLWPFGLGAAGLLVFSFCSSFVNKEYVYYRVIRQMKEIEVQAMDDITPNTRYYIPVYRLFYSIAENNSLKSVIEELRNNADRGEVDSCAYTSPEIVLIIGESYNRYHSHLYGYPLPTTPVQDSLYREGKIIPFTDVISSWNATCESFQNMLSLHSVGEDGYWYEEPFVTTMMRKSGYKVFFISNQFVTDPSTTFSSFVEDIFVNDRKLSEAQFDVRNETIHDYDEGLLDEYDHMKAQAAEHNLWIFHFMGLHADFFERYPASWKKFSAKDYQRPDLTDDDLEVLSDYDNAILYNDYVLGRIVSQFEGREAIIISLADHGERVFENCTVFGRNLTWDANDIKQQFSIPFWIYASDLYRERHPEIWEAVKQSANKRYMTDIISHTILSLGGVSTSYYRPRYDILSPQYDEQRKRIIREERDFDRIVTSN